MQTDSTTTMSNNNNSGLDLRPYKTHVYHLLHVTHRLTTGFFSHTVYRLVVPPILLVIVTSVMLYQLSFAHMSSYLLSVFALGGATIVGILLGTMAVFRETTQDAAHLAVLLCDAVQLVASLDANKHYPLTEVIYQTEEQLMKPVILEIVAEKLWFLFGVKHLLVNALDVVLTRAARVIVKLTKHVNINLPSTSTMMGENSREQVKQYLAPVRTRISQWENQAKSIAEKLNMVSLVALAGFGLVNGFLWWKCKY